MAKMMTSFAFSCLCHHRGVSGYAGTPWFPAVEAHTEHRALVQPDDGSIVPPPPDPEDLAGKYGVQAPAKDFEATLLGPNPPPGDSDQVMLSTDRSPRSESKYLVERPSSCDTVYNARLAMKGSVQQSSVDRPVYSEHAPVMPGPGTRYSGTVTRYSVPPTTQGKQGTVTTLGIPIIPGSPSSTVTPGESVRPVHTGQKTQLEKADQCLAQSEISVLNSPDRSMQLEHNVHKQPGNMSNLQAELLQSECQGIRVSRTHSTATFWTSVFGHRSYRQPFGHRSHW